MYGNNQCPTNHSNPETIPMTVIDFEEIDSLIQKSRTIPDNYQDKNMCVLLSGSFLIMFFVVVLIVVFGLRNV